MTRAPNRRLVLGGLAATALTAPVAVRAETVSFRIVVIGGGYGGATAARMLKRLVPNCQVTLVERQTRYMSCPFSNLVIAGARDMARQRFGYKALLEEGIAVVQGEAVDIDADVRSVIMADGTSLSYDRLIMAPGIDLRWNALEGYTEDAALAMPHAWKAGPQTLLLRRQLEAMEDGGVVVMTIPAAPYRCPPGPYERASLIAYYLKTHKPRSKLILLDAKDRFSKQPLFQQAWAEHYACVLEWRGLSDDGGVRRVDPSAMTVETDFETIKADVVNVIPPQYAGEIARRPVQRMPPAGVLSMRLPSNSRLLPNIHVSAMRRLPRPCLNRLCRQCARQSLRDPDRLYACIPDANANGPGQYLLFLCDAGCGRVHFRRVSYR